MAKGKAKGRSKGRKPSAALATVRLRFANEGAMAKKKSGGKKGKRKSPRKGNPGRKGRRGARRRNPATFMGALGHLAGAAAVALASGAAVLWAQNKWAQPNASTGAPNNAMLYGIPAVTVGLAALVAKKAPTVAVGLATGAVAGPFALAAFSKVQGASTTPSQTAAATTHGLSAVRLGQLGWVEPMSSVQLGTAHAYAGY